MQTQAHAVSSSTDWLKLRQDFPVLSHNIHNKPLVYLDNAATSQTPQVVIDAIDEFYQFYCSNVHRGVHTLSQHATEQYEAVRDKVRAFINAPSREQIIFTRSTTEAINLVANAYGTEHIGPGDEILISHMEHHSNIVPWQMLAERQGATLKVIPINDRGELEYDAFEKLLHPKTKMVAITHISNALGTINPVADIIKRAHSVGAVVLVDGAQATPHIPVDVTALDCDFYAFSGHKMYGPTGIGVLYGKRQLLEKMPPYQGGGDMILSVTFEKTTYADLPYRFEAGTPNIAGAIGLGRAIDYLNEIGLKHIAKREQQLLSYALGALQQNQDITFIGRAEHRCALISFIMKDIHPHDIGTILDHHGIAIRTGHHCAQPVMQRFQVPATARASFAFYNTTDEIDALVQGLREVQKVMQP